MRRPMRLSFASAILFAALANADLDYVTDLDIYSLLVRLIDPVMIIRGKYETEMVANANLYQIGPVCLRRHIIQHRDPNIRHSMRRLRNGAPVVCLLRHGEIHQHHFVNISRHSSQLRHNSDRRSKQRIECPCEILQPRSDHYLFDADQERCTGLYYRPRSD